MNTRDEVTVTVAASPDEVYALVTDLRRAGEWSTECYRSEWIGGATGPAVGARFKAWNRRRLLRWSNTPEVTAAEPGREFAFRRVAPGAGEVVWRYQIVPGGAVSGCSGAEPAVKRLRFATGPDGAGTVLTESYVIVRRSSAPVRAALYLLGGSRDRGAELRDGMTTTLARIKAAAEARSTV